MRNEVGLADLLKLVLLSLLVFTCFGSLSVELLRSELHGREKC